MLYIVFVKRKGRTRLNVGEALRTTGRNTVHRMLLSLYAWKGMAMRYQLSVFFLLWDLLYTLYTLLNDRFMIQINRINSIHNCNSAIRDVLDLKKTSFM